MFILPIKAKVTPTARASILVAIASIVIFFTFNISFSLGTSSSSSEKDSFIILKPIIPSNIKAIQWSNCCTYLVSLLPKK